MIGGSIGQCTMGSAFVSTGASSARAGEAVPTALAWRASSPGQSTSTDGPACAAGVVFTPSAPLLRARLTPARSVQRAAFSAMLRSVSWTLAGGETVCAAAMGRV
jgi:hypothetical protein